MNSSQELTLSVKQKNSENNRQVQSKTDLGDLGKRYGVFQRN